jgi:hypothetical protein
MDRSHRGTRRPSSLTIAGDTNELGSSRNLIDGSDKLAQITDIAVRPGHAF